MFQSSRTIASLVLLIAAFAPGQVIDAHHHEHNYCPECGCMDGGRFVEVTQQRCKMVPETKPVKKTVYECKKVPYCEHSLSEFGHPGCCPKCQNCAKYKTVLVKKEIKCGEKTEMICVPEEVTVLVPVACPKCGHRCKTRS